MKKTILVVGPGQVGAQVIALLRRRARVLALVRQPAQCARMRNLGATPIVGDLDSPRSLRALRAQRIDAVIHLAPPPNAGRRDTRTRHLLPAIVPKHQTRLHFVYVSTTGVYGDRGGAWTDESQPPHPESARALRRVDAERQIARQARRNDWRATVLRAPGIYDAQRLPLDRLRAGTPAFIAVDDVYTNHVHSQDLAAMCVAALRSRRRWRIYHACDDTVLRMGEYFDLVADAFGLPHPPRLPRDEVARRVPALTWSFMRESRRLRNDRIKRELGVRLRHPTIAEFLNTRNDAGVQT
jgi:nucleoside-diphosphate-sugar epimerase